MSKIMEEKKELELNVEYSNTQVAIIEFNHDELKMQIASVMEKYKGLTFTEEKLKEAKKIVADLRKKKTMFDDERKRQKNEYLAPINAFDEKFKEVVGLIQEPIDAIAKQITVFEEQQRAQRVKNVEDFWETKIGDLFDNVKLGQVYKGEWANASTSNKTWMDAITTKVTSIRADLSVLEGLKSDFIDELRETYFECLDLSTTMQKNNRLVQAKIDREKREEEARIAQEKRDAELKSIQETLDAPIPCGDVTFEPACDDFDINEIDFNPQPQPEFEAVMVQPESDEQTDEEIKNMFDSLRTEPRPIDFAQTPAVSEPVTLKTMTFWALGSLETLEALKSFMVDNDIEFEIVEG